MSNFRVIWLVYLAGGPCVVRTGPQALEEDSHP